MGFCHMPFYYVEVQWRGEVYCCCSVWLNGYSFGNIFKNTFDEIWYSDKAVELRKKILEGDYSTCNLKICRESKNCEENLSAHPDYPKYVKFGQDGTCNYKCITCRDQYISVNDDEVEKLNSRIDDVFLPMLKNAEVACFSSNGEPFASKHYKELIKRGAETYPNLMFDLHTNGSLLNEKNCKELGIIDKLSCVEVSVHAASEDTYRLITGGNFKTVLKNLQWLSEMKKDGKLNEIRMSFVVHKLNYMDMPAFVDLAESFGAKAFFWDYVNWGTAFGNQYSQMAIFNEFHPEYKKFYDIITQDCFKKEHCVLNPLFKELSQKPYVRKILL